MKTSYDFIYVLFYSMELFSCYIKTKINKNPHLPQYFALSFRTTVALRIGVFLSKIYDP